MEDAREAPWVVLERLDVLDLDQQNVAGLGGLDFEWSGQVVHLRQVDVLDVVGAVVVLDLSARPVQTFDLDCLAVLDGAAEGDYDTDVQQGSTVRGHFFVAGTYRQGAICSWVVVSHAPASCLRG